MAAEHAARRFAAIQWAQDAGRTMATGGLGSRAAGLDALGGQATGQPSARIYPSSESKWFYRVVDAQISFQPDAQGRCHGLILHQNGRDLPAQRMPEEEEQEGSKSQ